MGTRKADTITGTDDADDIFARQGGDEISALGGNDTIMAGEGSDTSDGGDGNDRYRFAGGWGKDTIAADSSGQDKVRFLHIATGVDIALDDQHPSIPRGASSGRNKVTFAGNFIENAGGGSRSDTIAGSSSDNRLKGNRGHDRLYGADGNDYLNGGEDNDKLNGGDGDDAYGASSGKDVINDASGSGDALDLGDHSSGGATFAPVDGSDTDDNYEDLSIDLSRNTVLIKDYFDNSAPKASTSGMGTGLIEDILFSDGDFDFGDVQSRIDPPAASNDSASTDEDMPVVIDVLANDTGSNLSVKDPPGNPAHGTATLITEDGPDKGKVRYNPDADYNNTTRSPDTFTYEACDSGTPAQCDEATVSVTVNPVNDKPSFTSQGNQTVGEDPGQQTVAGWATFDPGPDNESNQQVADYIVSDENGDPLNSSLFTQNGQPDVSNSGTLSYTPAQDASGSITVKVAVKDGGGTDRGGVDTSDPQTFTISITSENDLPTISNIANQTIAEDGNTGELGFTIGDVESDVGALTLTGSSSDTTLVPNANIVFGGSGANPTVTVTPAANEFGTVTIEVKVEDPDGGSSTETFQLTVTSVNDPPEANDDTKTTAENTPLVFPASDLLTNDSEGAANESAQTLTVTQVSNPLNGTVSLDSGQITFTPDTDYTGPASFEYTVCDDGTPQECSTRAATVNVTVSRVNSKPVAQDGTATMDEDAAPIQIDLGALVSDAETSDANLTYTIVSGPTSQQGTLTGSGPTFTFDSADNFNGTVEISYKVTDRGDPDNCGAPGPSCEAPEESDVKTVTITVNSVVDPPVISSGGTLSYTENDAPKAVDDGLSVTHPDGTQITEATVQITGNYQNGEDVLAFSDNDAGDGITQSGSFDSGTGELTLSGSGSAAEYRAALRAVTYENTSENPSTATRTVTFLATDANSATSAPATRSISTIVVDDAPVAVNDSATVLEDATATSVPVFTNDTDVDGGPKTISSASDPANGTVTLTGGSPGARTGLTYQPDADYCNDPPATNLDTFTYTLNGGSTATVSMTVTCVNDAPVADDETFNSASRAVGNTSLVGDDPDDGAPDPSGPQKTITGDILAGDTDIDGPGPLAVQAGTFNTNDGGTVVIQADGDFTFHPKAGTSCTDHEDFFDYTVTDQNSTTNPGTPGTDTGRVTVEIQDCVWYVDSSAGSNGDGRSHTPFNSLAGVNGAGDADDASQRLFLYDGSYSGGLPLENSQTLFSQRHGLVVPDGGAGNLTLEPAVPAGPNTTITGGLTLANGNTIQGIHLSDTSGTSLSGSSVGTATMNTATSGAINNTTGKAVDISNGTLDMAFTGVSSNNSSSDGIRLDNVAGTFNAAGGSVQNAVEQDIDISGNNSGDTVDFTYDGSITDDQGALVNVSNQNGGSKTFSGAITDGDDGDGSGISLTDNTGATVNFTGGLTLSTGSNAAFAATGGGTVHVCDENPCAPSAGTTVNKLTTGTGTTLNIANTTIGSNGLTFRSIAAGTAASGPTNGIVLNSTGTSGGLSVTGTGSTAGSGGTIQNSTDDAVSLTNTRDVALKNMLVTNGPKNGIYGSSVTNFSLVGSSVTNFDSDHPTGVAESGLSFSNLLGTSDITSSTMSGTKGDNVRIDNTSGTLNLTVSGSTIGPNPSGTGANGLALLTHNSANATVTVANDSRFTGNQASGFLTTISDTSNAAINISGATFQDNNINVDLGSSGTGMQNINVTGNTLLRANSNSVNIVGDGAINGTISNNFIGNGTADSGSRDAFGIAASQRGNPTWKLAIMGNTVKNTDFEGIFVRSGDNLAGDTGTLNLTLTGNTVFAPDDNSGFPANPRGMHIRSRQASTLCANIANNESQGQNGGAGYHLQESDTSQLRLQGFNSNGATTLTNNNNKTGGAAPSVSTFGEPFAGSCTAQTP